MPGNMIVLPGSVPSAAATVRHADAARLLFEARIGGDGHANDFDELLHGILSERNGFVGRRVGLTDLVVARPEPRDGVPLFVERGTG